MNFELIAKKVLTDLYVKLDEDENLEVELTDDGVLTIKAENGEYCINKHNATGQIWYSSPVSKLKYFIYNGKEFTEKRDPKLTLEDALFEDLRK